MELFLGMKQLACTRLRKDFFSDTCTWPATTLIFFPSPFPLRWQQDPFTDATCGRQQVFQQKHIQWQTADLPEASRKHWTVTRAQLLSSMDFGLDIVHILILHGATLQNFPPIVSWTKTVVWMAAAAKVGRSSPMSSSRPRTIRAETDTWQPVRFQFKEPDQTPPFTLQGFTYWTPQLLQHFLFTWCPHDQAALAPTLTTCQAPSTRHPLLWWLSPTQWRKVSRWCLQQSLGRAAHRWQFFLFCFALLSFIFLPYIRTVISYQITLYLGQITTESFPQIDKWPTPTNHVFLNFVRQKEKRLCSYLTSVSCFFF